MIEAAFETATRLFNVSFRERRDVPVYHPDVRVWEVLDKSGAHIGVFLGDYFARPSKRSGAWMSSYRDQHRLNRAVTPIIVNVMNFARGADGSPTLLSFDDARTLFHEFGHGLHGLLSNVTFPTLAGTNVARDFVELPSQLFEHWLARPEILKKFALHCETGKPIPDQLLKRLHAAKNFNQGFATVEFTASALIDLDLHEAVPGQPVDIRKMERLLTERIGMPDAISMRHRVPHFLHIMGGYAAGYYSYLWSEVMDADAFSAFEETGDVFHKPTAKKLKTYIYSAGNLRDPHKAYVAFRGRPPEVQSMLKKRGLTG
jgi:peptidyl-dipeptidase Dcp